MRLGRYITLFLLLLISLVVLVPGAGAYSFKVVADEPVEDILVTCVRSRRYLVPLHSSSYSEFYKTLVVNSGERFSCGLNVLGSHSSLYIKHPTHVIDYEEDGKDVDRVIHMRSGLQVLDDVEHEYEDAHESLSEEDRDRLDAQAHRACPTSVNFMERYLEAYSEVAALDYQRMKSRYYADSRLCLERAAAIRYELGRAPAGYFVDENGRQCRNFLHGQCPNPEFRPQPVIDRTMARAWSRELWYPRLRGTEGERNRNLGMKYTYLVELRNDDGPGATWLLIDAYSARDIADKYPGLVPHREPPRWMSESQRDRYTRDCDGTPLHWDIDEEPTGWLKHYAAGDVRDIVCK